MIGAILGKLNPFSVLKGFWREATIAVLVVLAVALFNSSQATKREFSQYQAQVAAIGEAAKKENARKEKQVQAEFAKVRADHAAELEEANIDRYKIKEDLHNEIIKGNAIRNALARTERLLHNNTSESGAGEVSKAAIVFAETKRDSDRAIEGLINAGKSCYYDYKALYESWQKQCDVYGCI